MRLAVATEDSVVHTESFLRGNEQNWTSYSLGGIERKLTNTWVRTTYIRDIKIEREHASSESLRVLSVNSDISGFRETVIITFALLVLAEDNFLQKYYCTAVPEFR